MNKNVVFRGFVSSLIVTGPVGILVFRFLPSWGLLVGDVGVGGAWGVLVISHLLYSWVIGIATFLFLTLLEKLNFQGSPLGAGVSAALTVTIAHLVSLMESADFGGFLFFSLWLAWMSWVVNFVVFMIMKWIGPLLKPTTKNEGAG